MTKYRLVWQPVQRTWATTGHGIHDHTTTQTVALEQCDDDEGGWLVIDTLTAVFDDTPTEDVMAAAEDQLLTRVGVDPGSLYDVLLP